MLFRMLQGARCPRLHALLLRLALLSRQCRRVCPEAKDTPLCQLQSTSRIGPHTGEKIKLQAVSPPMRPWRSDFSTTPSAPTEESDYITSVSKHPVHDPDGVVVCSLSSLRALGAACRGEGRVTS